MNELDILLEQYFRLFQEYPPLPICASYDMIQDLIEDAVVSKKPITPEEANEAVTATGIKYDYIKNIK